MSVVRRLLRLPLDLLPASTVVPILRGPLRGYRWLPASGVHSYWLGRYELPVQRAFIDSVSPGDVVIDVGANVGFYTLLASVLVGIRGHVVAFEPLPRNLDFLRRHLEMNDVKNVTVIPAAVSDFEGETLFAEGHHPAMGRLAGSGERRVRTVTLDEAWKGLALPDPRAIKIDVEGGEDAVLRGARQLLRRARPDLLLSTHGTPKHDDCCRFLAEYGYSFHLTRDGSRDGMYELIASREGGKR